MREFLEQKIQNFNGNDKVIGVLPNGEEVVLVYETSGLTKDQFKDFNTGMIFSAKHFHEFKNYSVKPMYGPTKNHNIKHGEFITGGQNIKRDHY